MPFEVLIELFNSEIKDFQKVADEKKKLYCSVECRRALGSTIFLGKYTKSILT